MGLKGDRLLVDERHGKIHICFQLLIDKKSECRKISLLNTEIELQYLHLT